MVLIPKVIHILWVGPKRMPVDNIQTWCDLNPGFTVRVWQEDDVATLPSSRAYDWYYQQGIFNGCYNVWAPQVALLEGGVFVGADASCNRTLDDAPFLHSPLFFAVCPPTKPYPRVFNNGFGSVPDHPIMAEYVERQSNLEPSRRGLHPAWDKSGGTLFWKAAEPHLHRGDFMLIPGYALFTEYKKGDNPPEVGFNYGSHFWGTTRSLYDE